jgi:hypothetical protein
MEFEENDEKTQKRGHFLALASNLISDEQLYGKITQSSTRQI